MDQDATDLALIERKLQGLLSTNEEMDFEDRLVADHEFARKYRLRQSFPSLFHADGPDVIGQHADAPLAPAPGNPSSHTGRKLIVALLLVVLAGFLIYTGWRLLGSGGDKPAQQPPPAKKAIIAPAIDSIADKPDQKVQENSSTALAPPDSFSAPILLDAPGENIAFSRSDEIHFRWQMETDSFTNFYILKVPDGKMVWWRGIRPGIREYILPPVKLSTGEYYWYVGQKKYGRKLQIKD